jgi:hypothetical protein
LFDSADVESVSVKDCVFEAGTNTSGMRGTSINRLYNPVISGNWFGDGSGALTWIDGLETQSNAFVGTISGNRFASAGTGGVHLNLEGKWLVMGNSFESGSAYDSASPSNLRVTSISNFYNVDDIFEPTSFTNGYPENYIRLDTGGDIVLDEQVGIHGAQASLAAPIGNETLVLGIQANAGFPTNLLTTRAAAIYRGVDGSRDALFLVGPEGGGSEGDVVIVTNDNAGAFERILTLRSGGAWAFGAATTPAVPATYTVTNHVTDRAYDANATTADELADVLGTLIADLRAKGIVN